MSDVGSKVMAESVSTEEGEPVTCTLATTWISSFDAYLAECGMLLFFVQTRLVLWDFDERKSVLFMSPGEEVGSGFRLGLVYTWCLSLKNLRHCHHHSACSRNWTPLPMVLAPCLHCQRRHCACQSSVWWRRRSLPWRVRCSSSYLLHSQNSWEGRN